ncbi:MAG: adenine phosphoribosyltransferase [Elusimicrobia bacterium RIFCSPLOWO2_01_FULL_64_13]|nr:MAG: adenine phosphoribosyltransferase [Elusimicrobia bacterium RIFCSPHIGHO2_01_FULL_64_10]OGR94378.1 MAG: adenine phosphoribosyltransferase [Elusimicrobia bacterium RIFCSPLOWO2_01_FULL_64_13]
MNHTNELKRAIRDVPDFPKKGILFKDITTLLAKGKLFRNAVDDIVDRYKRKKIDCVVAVESRGFIFGSAIAYKLGAGLVPVRKKGKLPYRTIQATYALEYGTDVLEMHEDALQPGSRVLIVDDLLATGGTAKAAGDLVKRLGGRLVGYAFLIELGFLNGRKNLDGSPVQALIKY